MHWAEAGPGDDVGQVGVRLLAVGEVQVSLRQVNHLRLPHRQRANGAGSLRRQLVLHREHMDHHCLRGGGGHVTMTTAANIPLSYFCNIPLATSG